jgi:hypothetical protein
MQCHEFRKHLHEYLRGRVSEPLFGMLVEHEAECLACRAGAAELDVEPAGATLRSSSEEKNIPVRHILERTAGQDCRWVELRMAEALEEELPADLLLLVSSHVAGCASCRRMRDMLQALPSYYGLLPALQPSREFTGSVLARTVGRRPGFFDVVRAMWRRPEAMWEAALACAVAVMLLFGQYVPTVDEVTQRVEAASQATGLSSFDPFRGSPEILDPLGDALGAARSRWGHVESGAIEVSAWARRVSAALHDRDSGALLREIRLVLDPLGLYPGNGDETESVQSGGKQNDSAPAGVDSIQTTLSGEVR